MSEYSTGSSSIEINKSAKGEYSYSIKLYFSGTTISAMKVIVDRVLSVKEYLEEHLKIEKEK